MRKSRSIEVYLNNLENWQDEAIRLRVLMGSSIISTLIGWICGFTLYAAENKKGGCEGVTCNIHYSTNK
jgi:hypothetical protein